MLTDICFVVRGNIAETRSPASEEEYAYDQVCKPLYTVGTGMIRIEIKNMAMISICVCYESFRKCEAHREVRGAISKFMNAHGQYHHIGRPFQVYKCMASKHPHITHIRHNTKTCFPWRAL
jgi:hypothetical protein